MVDVVKKSSYWTCKEILVQICQCPTIHSGSQLTVQPMALIEPGDTVIQGWTAQVVLTTELLLASPSNHNFVSYSGPWNRTLGLWCYLETSPRNNLNNRSWCVSLFSNYRLFKRLIADAVGAKLMVDMAHALVWLLLGHPSPFHRSYLHNNDSPKPTVDLMVVGG